MDFIHVELKRTRGKSETEQNKWLWEVARLFFLFVLLLNIGEI